MPQAGKVGLEFLTVSVAARMAGLSEGAIKAAADRGDLRIAARTSTRGRLFTTDDVERFASDRAMTAARARASAGATKR